MNHLQRIQRIIAAAKKLSPEEARKAALIGMEIGRRMRRHVNAVAAKKAKHGAADE
jgi:hypothetical protein